MNDAKDETPNLALLQGQDPEAFGWLVHRHERIVLGLAQAMGLKGADLEDAAAEAFAAVYRALPQFEGHAAVSTWVYAITVRTLRRFRTRLVRSRSDPIPNELPDDSSRRPEEIVDKRELYERIWSAVAGLDPRMAMAIELHYRRGLSVNTIAEMMECPAGTVKTLLFRAREALRKQLSQERAEQWMKA